MSLKSRWRLEPATGSPYESNHGQPGIRTLAECVVDEWPAIQSGRSNVLLEGPEAATEAVVRAWTPSLRAPFGSWTDGPPTQRPATLFIPRLTAIRHDDQELLVRWLDLPGERMQVISMTNRPLFPFVERGRFHPTLYYRLNVIRIDLLDPRHSFGRRARSSDKRRPPR